MSVMKPELVETWIEYMATKSMALRWSDDEVINMASGDPESTWEFILLVSERSNNLEVLIELGGGPLQDILLNFGPSIIDRFETHTRQNPSFVPVALAVWGDNENSEIEDRVRAVQAKYS